MNRSQRLFDLLSLLRSGGRSTVGELAEALSVSARTIHRDIATLTGAGVPVVTETGRYGGVHLLPAGRSMPDGLSVRERDLLQATGLDLDRASQLGQEAVARAAIGKLGRRSSRPRKLSLSEVVVTDNRPWFGDSSDAGDVEGIAEAVQTGNRLAITYRRSGERGDEERLVDPYGLLSRGGRWYLIADRDGSLRQYAVSRVVEWELVDAPRRLRPGVGLQAAVEELAERLERPAETVDVVAELDAGSVDLARRILGSRLTAVDSVGSHDKSVTITVTYRQVEDVRQLLQFGDHIEVTSPPGARALVAQLGAAIVRRHDDAR